MAKFLNASLYGTPYIEVPSQTVKTITEEKTEPVSCTIRGAKNAGHFRVVGTKEEVCNTLGLDVKVIPSSN